MGLVSLASASLNANPGVSKTLVATRANAHAMKTPLFFAARNNGHSEVIELLLSAPPTWMRSNCSLLGECIDYGYVSGAYTVPY